VRKFFKTPMENEAFKGCNFDNCYITKNNDYFGMNQTDKFDAIIFRLPYEHSMYWKYKQIRKMIGKRRPNQLYIFRQNEAPRRDYRCINKHFSLNFFNWTWTYRTDSDIVESYGPISKKIGDPKPPSTRRIQLQHSNKENRILDMSKKTKLAFWLNSHCKTDSKREDYVKSLQKYIHIDIYGKCGPLKYDSFNYSAKYQDMFQGFEKLAPNYKFYLSFENSNCHDYITEKFYKTMGRHVVPVVMGGADYRKFAPDMSFIDAHKYSPKNLADLLLQLNKNDDKYLEYFKWTEKSVFYERLPFCELCHKLNFPIEFSKTYKNITHWWLHYDNNKFVCDV